MMHPTYQQAKVKPFHAITWFGVTYSTIKLKKNHLPYRFWSLFQALEHIVSYFFSLIKF
jgi:hypothetical protein